MPGGVDIEALAVGALLDDAAVIAIAGDRVYTDLPAQPRFPLALLSRIGGLTDIRGHLDSALVQVEAWAKERSTAQDLASAALAALLGLQGTYDDGVVSGAAPFTGIAYLQDPLTATPRFIFRLTIYAHPLPASA